MTCSLFLSLSLSFSRVVMNSSLTGNERAENGDVRDRRKRMCFFFFFCRELKYVSKYDYSSVLATSLRRRRRYEHHRRARPRDTGIVCDERRAVLSTMSSHTTLHFDVVVVVRETRMDVFSFWRANGVLCLSFSLSLFISSFEVDALDETEVSSTMMMMMNQRSAFLGWCCAFLWHDEESHSNEKLEARVSVLLQAFLTNQRSANGVPLADVRERERVRM